MIDGATLGSTWRNSSRSRPTPSAAAACLVDGVSKAEAFVQVLYRSGKNPTRASFMNALLSMNYPNKFLLPGMVQKTSRTDHFVISQMQLQRFNGNTKLWVPFGKLIEGRPR